MKCKAFKRSKVLQIDSKTLLTSTGKSNASTEVNESGSHIKSVVSELSRLVVPGEYMMVVVPALAHCQKRDNGSLNRRDVSTKDNSLVENPSTPYRDHSGIVIFTHLSYGLLPYMCATLFTKKATLRVQVKRILKLIQKDIQRSSSQKYQGTMTGNMIEMSAKRGI